MPEEAEKGYVAETERLYLEPLDENIHLEGYHAIWSDPQGLIWSSHDPHTEISQSLELINQFNYHAVERPWLRNYAIILKPNQPLSSGLSKGGELIGFAGVVRTVPSQSSEDAAESVDSNLAAETATETDAAGSAILPVDNGHATAPSLNTIPTTSNVSELKLNHTSSSSYNALTSNDSSSQPPTALEMGYCLSVPAWGHGYATEAVKAFITHYWTLPAFPNVTKLVAYADTENIASQKVLKKSGARFVEIAKGDYELNGQKRDSQVWEWERPV